MSTTNGRAALATMMTLATMFDSGHGTRRYKPVNWEEKTPKHKTDAEKEDRKQGRKKLSTRKKRRGY